MAGLLDYLYNPSTYGGDPGLLSRLMPSLGTVTPSAGFDPTTASNGSGRQFNASLFDPSTYAPSQPNNPIAVGNYQMPRIGNPDQFQPQQALLPANAQPTQGQDMMQAPAQQPAQQPLPPALGGNTGGGGFLANVARGFQSIGNGGSILGALTGNYTDPQSTTQQNLKAQYDSLVPVLGPQKAMLAVMNPTAGKLLLDQQFGSDNYSVTPTGEDGFGNKTYSKFNKKTGEVTPLTGGGSQVGAPSSSLLSSGVSTINPNLTGDDYLKQFSPEVQAAVQNYVAGKSLPTGNPRKGFTQTVKMIAQKYGADTGQTVDDSTFMARKTLRNQLSSSSPSSLGGQINIGNTAAGHLADLSQRALELDNSNGFGIPALAHGINEIRGATSVEQSAKMAAVKGAAQHYGQEITKFYAGSPGGVAERDRFIEAVNAAKSPKELAAILETEGELMRSRLDALNGQIKGVLGDEGLKEYPVLRPDGAAALDRLQENVSKLRGGATSTAPASTLPQGWSVKVR